MIETISQGRSGRTGSLGIDLKETTEPQDIKKPRVFAGFVSKVMSPASIGPVKAMLLGLDAEALTKAVNEALDDRNATVPMREVLARFAESHNIPL